jgi:SWI/SNF-related matrix-associated actin-dependent regulator 1 of chromatin subfamily A
MDAGYAQRPYGFVEGRGVRIIPYSRTRPDTAIMRATMHERWDVVIIDEGHYLKTASAQRTRAVYGPKIDLAGSPLRDAKHIWVLTGTPILNHPAEFWTHLHALAPEVLIFAPPVGVMNEDFFIRQYCVTANTPYGVRILGGRNTSDLAQRIKPVIDRKRIKDVILDLPDLRIVEHPLPADTSIESTLRDALNDAMGEFGFDKAELEQIDDDQLLATIQAGGVAFSTVRRLIGRAKVKPVAEMVSNMLDDGADDKVIVFAHHREVIRDLAIELKLYSPLVITGATLQSARENAINDFQTNLKSRLIILAIEAAGEVITLHASHNVVIMEPSPVPAKNHQAIARAHRKGQKHPVLARFVLLPGTLDARLMTIIARKTRDIAKIVDFDLVAVKPELAPHTGLDFPDDIDTI